MRDDLPSGTVTLVFSDIEGSTKLLERLGTSAYRQALAEHRQIVREAFARYRGYEVDYEGDAFFYAFDCAQQAVSAVSEAMQGLQAGPISIRVGIHTGEPELDPPKYVGMDVHTAARIMSSGHGGQIVVSKTTAALVETPLQELGEHRLKDIQEAVPLYQLGEGSFPPLKTISNTNLPTPASSFVGRDDELLEVLSRFEEGARLVTLTGPGGTGKTRLAIEAAASLVPEYKAGVFWVGLATLRDPALVTETIAQTLGAKDGLAEHVAEREILLLLDNLEQVIDAAPALSELLTACPNLTFLITSRELLRVQGEVEYAVPPLAEPEAVALFCERSQLEPSKVIAELCNRLDSLPLAVELAAARTSALTPEQILERLSQRLDVLKGGRDADPRQQTLRTTIEWSHELLSTEEQQLFARLSVFAGCTLEAAEEVCDADLDTLQSLVEKSLLRFTDRRYWMLETIREFAGERLDGSIEADDLRTSHADWTVTIARESAGANDGETLDRLEQELGNFRAALEWSKHSKHPASVELPGFLWQFWGRRNRYVEARQWLEGALAVNEPIPGAGAVRERLLAGAAWSAFFLGDLVAAQDWGEQRLAIARSQGDEVAVARSLSMLGSLAAESGDFDQAVRLAEESVAISRSHNAGRLANSIHNLGVVWERAGDGRRARDCFAEALELSRSIGDSAGIAHESMSLGAAALLGGDSDEARVRLLEGIGLAANDRVALDLLPEALLMLSAVDASDRHWRRAALLLAAAESANEDRGTVLESQHKERFENVRERLASELDSHELDSLWKEGRAMTLDEAVEYALASEEADA